jgi:hypothetical protein
MARTSKLQLAKNKIVETFDRLETKVFSEQQLSGLLLQNQESWNLPYSIRLNKFIDFLIGTELLKHQVLISKNYQSIERYLWRNPSAYAIALSIKNKSYLSHGSAVFLHGLTDLIPKTIFVNKEQSPKTKKGTLIQENIHRAFQGRQRQSQLIYDYEKFKITVISGMATNQLGVIDLRVNDESLRTTDIERTLIDIAVRPAYSGGVFEVLEVYKQARHVVSVSSLVSVLAQLNYAYPYHQVIGFYMERAGYKPTEFNELLNLGIHYDFYLSYGLPADKQFDSKWRLFYPNGF